MLHIKRIPSIYGNGKQMKECDNTSWLQRSRLLKKIKVYILFPSGIRRNRCILISLTLGEIWKYNEIKKQACLYLTKATCKFLHF